MTFTVGDLKAAISEIDDSAEIDVVDYYGTHGFDIFSAAMDTERFVIVLR